MKRKVIIVCILVLAVITPVSHGDWLVPADGEVPSSSGEEPEAVPEPAADSGTEDAEPAGSSAFGSLFGEPAAPVPSADSGGESYEVSMIDVKKNDDSNIRVSWQNPEEITGFAVQVYRSEEVLDSPEKMNLSKLVTVTTGMVTSYTDNITIGGTYYYALVVIHEAKEYKDLTADQSYTTIGTVMGPYETKGVVALKAVLEEQNKVVVTWAASAELGLKFNVYRSSNRIQSEADLDKARKSQTPDREFTDILFDGGSYYYAVTSENAAGETRKVALGTNSLAEPVVYTPEPVAAVDTNKSAAPEVTGATQVTVVEPEPEKEEEPEPVKTVEKPVEPEKEEGPADDYTVTLLSIKRNYFYKEKYEAAAWKLREMVDDGRCPAETRNEAKLFLAKTYYHLKEYAKALKILVHLRDHYPDEADFWINRIANKL